MLVTYYPEMGQKQSAFIRAQYSYSGKFILKTKFDLKGQGVKFQETLKKETLTPQSQWLVGWKQYEVTKKAFDKLCSQYLVALECSL